MRKHKKDETIIQQIYFTLMYSNMDKINGVQWKMWQTMMDKIYAGFMFQPLGWRYASELFHDPLS